MGFSIKKCVFIIKVVLRIVLVSHAKTLERLRIRKRNGYIRTAAFLKLARLQKILVVTWFPEGEPPDNIRLKAQLTSNIKHQ